MTSFRGAAEIIGVRAVIIDIRQFLADGRDMERQLDRIGAAEKRLQAANVASNAAVAARTAAFGKAQVAFNAAIASRQQLAQIEAQIAKNATTIRTGRNEKGQFISQAAVAGLVKQQEDLKNSLKAARKETDELGKAAIAAGRLETAAGADILRSRAQQIRALEQQTAANNRLREAQLSRIRAASSAAALVGTAVIGGVTASAITSAAKYEQSLNKIRVLTSATNAETDELGRRFLQLSTQIPVSATELAAGAYLALSSGIKDVEEAYELTTVAAKAAVAGQADVESIVAAVTTVLNAYPKGAITATQATEILFAAVREGRGEFNDLANSIGRVVPAAAAMGVKFTEVATAMALMTNGGLNAEEAATALRAILQDLAKNDSSTQTIQALNAIGLSSEQLRQNIQDKGLAAALFELFTLFDRNITAIEPIIPNVRALTGALIAYGGSLEKTAIAQANINRSVGIVDQSFERTRNSATNLAKLFSNQLNVAFIEIGNVVLPSVTKALQELIQWLQQNRAEIRNFIVQGLQGIINVAKEAAKGIALVYSVLSLLNGVLKTIVGSSNSTKLALAAIGTGLAWALPGGPYIVGLTAILVALGQINAANQEGGPQGVARKVLPFVTGAAAAGVATVATGNPLIGAAAFGGGLAGGQKLTELLFGKVKPSDIKSADDLAKHVDDINKAFAELGNQTLPDLKTNIGGINKDAKEAAEELKKLAQEFLNTSEAAGQVESFTAEFKKFGTISKQLADAAGLSAAQSGAIQGVDAVIRAQERSQAEAFNYVQAINAVSEAFRRSAAVGRQLLFDLAQASLEASQRALSDVFSRPTREVANLNVGLARQQLNTAQINQRNNPAINALNKQLDAINKQIQQQNRANQIANRNAARQREQQQKAQDAARRAQERAQQAEADARKLAALQAQINAERQLAALQKLIDANNKAASDLQEAFLKSNNELQVQINTAIGKGDTTTALALVDQQRAATKQYREQSKALQKSTQDLTFQQKAAQEAEQERQRQQQLADALFESQQRQKDSVDTNTESTTTNTEAQEAQTQALEDSRQAIQDQIDALQAPIEASQQQEKTIQDNIAVFEAQTNVLKALGVAADKTLLTQEQQRLAAEKFTIQIAFASGQAQALAKSFYDFIPGAKDADLKFQTLNGALEAVNGRIDPTLLGNFDAVNARLDLLKTATEDVTTSFNNSSSQTNQNTDTSRRVMAEWQTAQEQILVTQETATGKFVKRMSENNTLLDKAFEGLKKSLTAGATTIGGSIAGTFKSLFKAQGGIFTKPTLGIIGEAGPEVVLPLSDVNRISQILKQASTYAPGTLVGTSGGSGGVTGILAQIASVTRSNGGSIQAASGAGGGSGGMLAPVASKSNMIVMSHGAFATALAAKSQSAAVFAPNITVTGQTLDTMEATAIAAVQKAFRDARNISGRTGGLITTGLGPSH